MSRQTAAKYLDRIVELGLLQKERLGKENYYINTKLVRLFVDFGVQDVPKDDLGHVESIHVKELPIS